MPHDFIKNRVSVIILSWNCRAYLQKCVEAVLAQTYSEIELILVDNGSHDGSAAFLKSQYPAFLLVENEHNIGFAAGMNLGIRRATGEYILPLNVDVFLQEDYVAIAVEQGMRRESRIGMVCGKVFRYDHGKTQQLADVGKYLVGRMTMKNSQNSEKEEFVFGPNGSCPLYRRKMLEDTELPRNQFYDEAYFAYAEDLDLHWRAQIAGWRCLYLPNLISWHVHSASVGGNVRLIDKPAFFQQLVLRNRHMNIIKNLPAALFLLYFPAIVLTELLTFVYFAFRRPGNLWVVFSAYHWTMKSLRETLNKRRLIQQNKRVTNRYLLSLFKGY